MSKLKIPSHEAREHTARIRALTHMAQVGHTEVTYWRLRDALSNLPPSENSMTTETKTWQDKAHRLIAEMSIQSWRQAGNGSGRKHRPYSIPATAQALVDALGRNDEESAKALFLLVDTIPALSR